MLHKDYATLTPYHRIKDMKTDLVVPREIVKLGENEVNKTEEKTVDVSISQLNSENGSQTLV